MPNTIVKLVSQRSEGFITLIQALKKNFTAETQANFPQLECLGIFSRDENNNLEYKQMREDLIYAWTSSPIFKKEFYQLVYQYCYLYLDNQIDIRASRILLANETLLNSFKTEWQQFQHFDTIGLENEMNAFFTTTRNDNPYSKFLSVNVNVKSLQTKIINMKKRVRVVEDLNKEYLRMHIAMQAFCEQHKTQLEPLIHEQIKQVMDKLSIDILHNSSGLDFIKNAYCLSFYENGNNLLEKIKPIYCHYKLCVNIKNLSSQYVGSLNKYPSDSHTLALAVEEMLAICNALRIVVVIKEGLIVYSNYNPATPSAQRIFLDSNEFGWDLPHDILCNKLIEQDRADGAILAPIAEFLKIFSPILQTIPEESTRKNANVLYENLGFLLRFLDAGQHISLYDESALSSMYSTIWQSIALCRLIMHESSLNEQCKEIFSTLQDALGNHLTTQLCSYVHPYSTLEEPLQLIKKYNDFNNVGQHVHALAQEIFLNLKADLLAKAAQLDNRFPTHGGIMLRVSAKICRILAIIAPKEATGFIDNSNADSLATEVKNFPLSYKDEIRQLAFFSQTVAKIIQYIEVPANIIELHKNLSYIVSIYQQPETALNVMHPFYDRASIKSLQEDAHRILSDEADKMLALNNPPLALKYYFGAHRQAFSLSNIYKIIICWHFLLQKSTCVQADIDLTILEFLYNDLQNRENLCEQGSTDVLPPAIAEHVWDMPNPVNGLNLDELKQCIRLLLAISKTDHKELSNLHTSPNGEYPLFNYLYEKYNTHEQCLQPDSRFLGLGFEDSHTDYNMDLEELSSLDFTFGNSFT